MWALRWVSLFVLWLALTDSRAPSELVAGAAAATIGATFSGLIVRTGRPRTAAKSLALLRSGTRALARPPLRVLPDAALLLGVLWRRLVRGQAARGSLRRAQLSPPARSRSATDRAVTEAWGSLAPNRYVIGVEGQRNTILVHELARSEAPLEPQARP